MKFTLLIFLLYFDVTAQKTITIVDSISRNSLSYVNIWFENKSFGTTADENGKFVLSEKSKNGSLVFNAVGYEEKVVAIAKINDSIFLIPAIYQLSEVKVFRKKKTKRKLGDLHKGKSVGYLASKESDYSKPFIFARRFSYGNIEDEQWTLKSVRLNASSVKKDAIFNLRIYSVGEDGAPKDFLYNQNIICEATSGALSSQKIDLSEYHITVPPTGFFIAVEWLIIERNKYEQVNDPKWKLKEEKTVFYQPSVSAVVDKNNTDSWMNIGGVWTRNENDILAAEVELGN